jgi:hypothetical protein
MAKSIYKRPEGEAEIRALYEEALSGLGLGYDREPSARASATHTSSLSAPRAPRPSSSSLAATP